MAEKMKNFVRVNKSDMALLIWKIQQDRMDVEYYDELVKLYEENVLNDIQKNRHTSTIKIDKTLKKALCI